MQALFTRLRTSHEEITPLADQRRIVLEKMEDRVLFDATLIDFDIKSPAPETQEFTPPLADVEYESPVVSSDPLGLTSSNRSDEEAPRVFIVDATNPNAISDITGIHRIDVTAETPLANLDALIDRSFLRDGDQLFIRNGEYVLSAPIRVDADNVVFSAYGDEAPTIRYGSFVYHWAMDVRGDGFVMDGIDLVGNIETNEGQLYSHLMLVVRGDDATIQNSTFRHNSNFLPSENGGDIAFGKRVDANGNPRSDAEQKWGRLVSFIGSSGSAFRNNVVVSLEPHVVAQWQQTATSIEGLMLEHSNVVVEFNQFGAVGHQMLSSVESTVSARHNTFGDVSAYAHLVDMPISEHVRVPATHTAAGLGTNDGSEFSHNLLVFNTADPLDTGNGLQIQGTTNSNVFNNLFVDSRGTGHAIHLGFNRFSTIEVETAYNRIFNNTFVNVPTPLNIGYFQGLAPVGGNAIHDNEVFNNLVVMSDVVKNSRFSSANVPLTANLGDHEFGNGNSFYNNLLFDLDGDVVFKSKTPNGLLSYTIDELNALPYAHGNLSTDPVFVNPEQGDFRLRASSPAIIADSDISQPLTDFEGRARPSDFVVIGAFGIQDVTTEPTFQIVAPDSFDGHTATLTVTADQPDTKRHSFHIDWNGDGQTDQTIHGPVGTELSHRYPASGSWTVVVDVADEYGQLLTSLHHDFTLTTGNSGTDSPKDNSEDPIPESPTATVNNNSFATIQLGEPSTDEVFHTYEIDWNGDGSVDQSLTAPAGTIVDHFFRSPGEYSVQIQQVTSDSGQVIATRTVTIRVEADKDEENPSEPVMIIARF